MIRTSPQKGPKSAFRAALIGGSLQGTEVAYLAAKAGWKTLLVDRNPQAPARTLAERFVCTAVEDIRQLSELPGEIDLIVPALEDDAALEHLQALADEADVPLAHDSASYAISSSKANSELFFRRCGVPVPALWPECGFPVICKPDQGSGSRGVRIFSDPQALAAWMDDQEDLHLWVIQEFLAGPTFSIEVIGGANNVFSLGPITDLYMDEDYDCKRVAAPSRLSAKLQEQFREIARQAAKGLDLQGIMDVEVILHDGSLRVLEIDARFPSQTPTAVYWSDGINLLEELRSATLANRYRGIQRPRTAKAVVYEHISVADGMVRVVGEHVMADAGALSVCPGFWGADEAITDYSPGSALWVATMIYVADDTRQAWAKRHRSMELLGKQLGLTLVDEPATSEHLKAIP